MKMNSRRKKISKGKIIVHIVLILMCLTFIIPFWLIIATSITPEADIKEFGYRIFPKHIDFISYKMVFKNPSQILNAYMVTIFSSTVGTFLAVILMSVTGYVLSIKQFAYKKIVSFYLFFTMLFNGGLIPSYIINTQYLGLKNNLMVYVALGLVSAWNVIIFRTFFQQLPESLTEAAVIDGANQLQIYYKIILPLSKPVFATITLLTVLTRWNDWTTSLYYISDAKLYSLQYLLQNVLRQVEFVKSMIQDTPAELIANMDQLTQLPTEGLRYALCVVAAGPMLLVFPFFQKYFAKGLTVGAVKG